MEVKKTKQADMTNRSGLYFLIGLNVVLLSVLLFLEFSRDYKEFIPPPEPVEVADTNEEVIITERQFNEPPPPIDVPKPPEIPVEIEVVKDDVKLEEPPKVQQQDNRDLQEYRPQGNPKAKAENTGPPVIVEKKEPVIETVDEELDISTAKSAPIYPGCEKYKGNNRELYQCFNKRFGSDIGANIDQDFQIEPGQKYRMQIAFKIDANGNLKISQINKGNASSEFVENAKAAFERVANTMERKARNGKGIQPALNSKNQPAVMKYSIPVSFTSPD